MISFISQHWHSPDQIPHSIFWNTAPNLQDTLLFCYPALNKEPFDTATYLDFWHQTTCCYFLYLFPICPVAQHLHEEHMLVSRWVYLSSTVFCQFWANNTAGHLLVSKGSKHDVSFIFCKFTWLVTVSMILNNVCSFALLNKPGREHLETSGCFEIDHLPVSDSFDD